MTKKQSRFLVGGADVIDGTWRAIFEIHSPCKGGEHKGCVVLERNISPPMESQAAAIETVYAVRDESGLVGWESCLPAS